MKTQRLEIKVDEVTKQKLHLIKAHENMSQFIRDCFEPAINSELHKLYYDGKIELEDLRKVGA